MPIYMTELLAGWLQLLRGAHGRRIAVVLSVVPESAEIGFPNGARADALIEDENNPRFEWDGGWNAAATRTPEGWSAEMSIPFSTLRFDGDGDTWGLNIRRLIRRTNEDAFWAPVGRDANLPRLSLAGELTGMGDLEPGINLRAKPFGIATSALDFETRPVRGVEEYDGGRCALRL